MEENEKKHIKKEIRFIFSVIQGLINLYFLWKFYCGLLNRMTGGNFFEYANYVELIFYIIAAISSFYFFVMYASKSHL